MSCITGWIINMLCITGWIINVLCITGWIISMLCSTGWIINMLCITGWIINMLCITGWIINMLYITGRIINMETQNMKFNLRTDSVSPDVTCWQESGVGRVNFIMVLRIFVETGDGHVNYIGQNTAGGGGSV